MAGSLALADAGVPTRDLVAAAGVARVVGPGGASSGALVLDPTAAEGAGAAAGALIALMPATDRVTQAVFTGGWGPDAVEGGVGLASAGAAGLGEAMRAALRGGRGDGRGRVPYSVRKKKSVRVDDAAFAAQTTLPPLHLSRKKGKKGKKREKTRPLSHFRLLSPLPRTRTRTPQPTSPMKAFTAIAILLACLAASAVAQGTRWAGRSAGRPSARGGACPAESAHPFFWLVRSEAGDLVRGARVAPPRARHHAHRGGRPPPWGRPSGLPRPPPRPTLGEWSGCRLLAAPRGGQAWFWPQSGSAADERCRAARALCSPLFSSHSLSLSLSLPPPSLSLSLSPSHAHTHTHTHNHAQSRPSTTPRVSCCSLAAWACGPCFSVAGSTISTAAAAVPRPRARRLPAPSRQPPPCRGRPPARLRAAARRRVMWRCRAGKC